MRLAIVGSLAFDRDQQASTHADQLITSVIKHYQPEVVVSGGAVGIDQLGARIARALGLEIVEFLPEAKSWKYYKARDLLIAQDCTHLLCIRHHLSRTYGSGWTADRAEEMEKPVRRYMYDGIRLTRVVAY